MISFFQLLFDTSGFPARWGCGDWTPGHGWLHIGSDLAIFAAYAAIPLTLMYFIRQRKDMPFIPLFWLFAAFILSCGFGHFIEATIFWHPWYRFSGVVKAVTAIVSWWTVFALVKVVPSALALPGLAKVNLQLSDEITVRKHAEGQLRQLTADLEQRVAQRTEALRQSNEQLEHKAKLLAEQNAEIEQARRALEDKAAELALSSKYKSEFLANMSHELRTPLNSILILGQQLAINAAGNLAPKQVEFARHIHSAGSDLLVLITDILDLAKIESGTVTVQAEALPFADLAETVERSFRHVAESKGLAFTLELEPGLPAAISSDSTRLQQILRNLLSNAFKFTPSGQVSLRVQRAGQGWSAEHPVLRRGGAVIAFAVTDTGIGIAANKQRLVFEAFQQADTGTSRKFGGTGLGLSICRELATLLGGEIGLVSQPGEGSTFTLYLPLLYTGPASAHTGTGGGGGTDNARTALPVLPLAAELSVADDRDALEPDDLVMLIVEDDRRYASVLLDLARSCGFKGLVALNGAAAISMARRFRPAAISLDLFLPDLLGWTVMNKLKLDPTTRHIPVQIISVEDQRHLGRERGAFGCLVKPGTTPEIAAAFDRLRRAATPHLKRLLVIEDHAIERQAIVELLAHTDLEITAVGSGTEALAELRRGPFDCAVLDLRLPDMSGFDLLDALQADAGLRELPVVVFTGQELTPADEARLRDAARSIVLKNVRSAERLLDETALFLHRDLSQLPPEKQQMIARLHGASNMLVGRKVLVVDDDARNIFAISTVLEGAQMEVTTASNGREAIERLANTPDLAVVLMDIMMPGMDGYEAMRQIRANPALRSLPIFALTAKAMKGDREKCLEAGASDYLAKPVNPDDLLALLRVWLVR